MHAVREFGRGRVARVSAGLGLMMIVGASHGTANAIDVKLSVEEAKKALEAGRAPMEKANTPEDVKKVLQQASLATRVGADPEKEPCGASAILRTKRYRLEAFGRQEAAESKKQKKDVRMPEEFIQKAGEGPAYRARVRARLALECFYLIAKTTVVVTLQDGQEIRFDADLSKVR